MGKSNQLLSKKYFPKEIRDELWKDPIPRSPSEKEKPQIEDTEKSFYDFTFFDSVCA